MRCHATELPVCFCANGLHIALFRDTSPSQKFDFFIPSCLVRVFCKDPETTPPKGATEVSDEGSYTYVPNFQAISVKEPGPLQHEHRTMFTYVTNYTSCSSFVSYGGLSRSMPADYLTNSHILSKNP